VEQHHEAGGVKAKVQVVKYAVIFEKSPRNYAAYVPDLPGCVATGKTPDEVERNIREAIAFHLDGLRLNNQPIPEPQSWTELVEV
jgi:predicted RNase H-like HicB family nuclease